MKIDIKKYPLLVPNLFDVILGVSILALSIGSLAWIKKGETNKNIKAVVYHENVILHEISLIEDNDIKLENMAVQIKNGRIRVVKSDCPHHICAHTGFISIPGQTIVCVPNKVLIEIIGQSASPQYHAVSY